MSRFLHNYRLNEHSEVLTLISIGMILQVIDGSPFTIKKMWASIWDSEFPREYFSTFSQHCVKTALSLIVALRCSTTYLYIITGMLVIMSITKNWHPKLMLPWLLIAGMKSILLNFVATLTGVYVCSSFGRVEEACIEFIIQKAVEIILATYLWGSVLNIYNNMLVSEPVFDQPEPLTQQTLQKADLKKRRARSLIDESILMKTARMNHFEFKDVPKILMDMLRKEEELSQDSLIGPGMMLASVSNMGSFDHLKTSQSLGELGSLDLKTFQVVGLEEDQKSSPMLKAMKFMKLTWNDIRKAKRRKKTTLTDLYNIEDSIWENVISSGRVINRPKSSRPEEVFVKQLHQEDSAPKKKIVGAKSIELKTKLVVDEEGSEYESEEDEETQVSTTEAEDFTPDESTKKMFMTNIREGTSVRRIQLQDAKQMNRANNFANLYNRPCMSSIGPELYDNASKLKQLTGLDMKKTEVKVKVEDTAADDEEKNREMELSTSTKLYKKKIYFDDQLNYRNDRMPDVPEADPNYEPVYLKRSSFDLKTESVSYLHDVKSDESKDSEPENVNNSEEISSSPNRESSNPDSISSETSRERKIKVITLRKSRKESNESDQSATTSNSHDDASSSDLPDEKESNSGDEEGEEGNSSQGY